MNEIVNKFFLTGDKFIPEMHLRQPRFIYCAYGPFTKKKEYKKLKKQETQDVFAKTSKIKPAFSIIWPMGISKIYREKQLTW